MSEIHSSPPSPMPFIVDAVSPLIDASMESFHQTFLMIHNEFIHPWSTTSERKGPSSEARTHLRVQPGRDCYSLDISLTYKRLAMNKLDYLES